MRKPRVIRPTPPGEMLEEEFLIPMEMSQTELAQKIGCSPRAINEICRGKRGISATIALRLFEVFKNSPEFWMNLQMATDLWNAWIELKQERKAI